MSIAMSSSQRATIALGSIGAIIAVLSVAAWGRLPVADDPSYFNFADQRTAYGLPHFYDVVSNIFFIYVSLFSFFFAIRFRHFIERRILECFLVFSVMVFLTGWGSSYFHLFARPEYLVWDRLPLAMAFSSLLTLVLTDRVVFYYHRILLLVLNVLGFWSAWSIDHGAHDLRTYILVQFGSLIAMALILAFFRKGHISRSYLWVAFAFYAAAKFCEVNDHQIYAFFREHMSGHTLKHLLAAAGIFAVSLGVLNSGRGHQSKP